MIIMIALPGVGKSTFLKENASKYADYDLLTETIKKDPALMMQSAIISNSKEMLSLVESSIPVHKHQNAFYNKYVLAAIESGKTKAFDLIEKYTQSYSR